VEDRIVVESERAAQSGRAGVRCWPRIRRASASAGTTGARASSLPRQASRSSSRARQSTPKPDRRGGRAATTSAPTTAPPALRQPKAPAAYYFPRDFFFCLFTFKLTIGAFAPVPRDTGLCSGCFFDFPAMPILLDRGREATDEPTLQAVGGCVVLCAGAPLARSACESVEREKDGWTGLAARTLAETPNGRQRAGARPMEPWPTEFTSQASTLAGGRTLLHSPSPTSASASHKRCDEGESLGSFPALRCSSWR